MKIFDMLNKNVHTKCGKYVIIFIKVNFALSVKDHNRLNGTKQSTKTQEDIL